jgi:hypothetical protein
VRGCRPRDPGVEPVEYLWQPRGSYFYLLREIALAESSRETRKIYSRYFALSPAYPVTPSPRHPALFIRRNRRPPSRVFSSSFLRACGFPSRSPVPLRPGARWCTQGKTPARLSPRGGPLLSSALRESARVFERRQRDMLMPIGAVKSWATAESRISIKAIEKDAGGWPLPSLPPAPSFAILLFTVQLGPGRGENAPRTRIPAADDRRRA